MVRNAPLNNADGGGSSGNPSGRGSDRHSAGTIAGLTRPDTDAVLNVDEYASVDSGGGARWGFPRAEGQSLSYWLQQVRCDDLLDYRSTPELPPAADCVVIGSGITGSLAAKTYRETWPDRRVVVLEARDFCSGATGRNAGHCKPDVWRGYGKYEKMFGDEQAMKILRNEQETWQALVQYVREHAVDCDLWVGDTLDVPMSADIATLTHDIYDRFVQAGGDVSQVKVTTDPCEAARMSRLKGAHACYAWPSSTLQPRKLTGHIMRAGLALGVELHTFTTVRAVSEARAPQQCDRRWTVHTDRGAIDCSTVVHATNAYTPAHEPLFRGLIQPNPHMCNKVIPPLSFAGSRALRNSYGVLLPDGALYSINPRCTTDGVVLFGGSNPGQRRLEEWIDAHPEFCVDDGFANVKEVRDGVREFAEAQFDGWKDGRELGPGQGYDYSWSGIIGQTPDGLPLVGEVPGRPGQWVCAGHNGHGMARTFTAAPALVSLMKGESWESTGLPEVFRITPQRIERLREIAASARPRVTNI